MSEAPLTLVADIGGTNSRLALAEAGRLRRESLRRYANREFGAPEDMLRRYLGEMKPSACAGACIAMAGPVRNGAGQMTNLGWSLSEERLRTICRTVNTRIINDLQAQAHALEALPEGAVLRLLPPARTELSAAEAAAKGVRLVVGIGTGFNCASVHEFGAEALVPASETGHVSLPCPTREDFDFAAHLRSREGAAEIEHALSGLGLKRLYSWHRGGSDGAAPEGPEILAAAKAGSDEAATRTLEQFLRLLGQVLGDLALIHLPEGGIYLTGSVARAMAPHLQHASFRRALAGKGRFADLRGAFPLWLIEKDWAALAGCAALMHHAASSTARPR